MFTRCSQFHFSSKGGVATLDTQEPTTSERMGQAVSTAVNLAPDESAADRLRSHCLAEAEWVFKRIRLTDFETSELLALLAVICPVHSRRIDADKFINYGLRLVGDDAAAHLG